MKSVKMNVLVIALASLGLAACGGSGDNAAKPQPVNNPTTGTPTTGTPTTGIPTSVPGHYMPANAGDTVFEPIKTMTTVDDINKFIVDGKTYATAVPGIQAGSFFISNSKDLNIARGGTTYQYARWGVLDDVKAKRMYLYAQGKPATNMPTTGAVVYQGHAVHGNDKLDTALTGGANFTVDFANKTLAGVVDAGGKNAQYNNIQLSAKVSGNSFSGTHGTSGYTTQGGFYGPGAPELAGVFHDEKRFHVGSFGAAAKK